MQKRKEKHRVAALIELQERHSIGLPRLFFKFKYNWKFVGYHQKKWLLKWKAVFIKKLSLDSLTECCKDCITFYCPKIYKLCRWMNLSNQKIERLWHWEIIISFCYICCTIYYFLCFYEVYLHFLYDDERLFNLNISFISPFKT